MKISLLTDSNAVLVKKFCLSLGVSALLGLVMAVATFILSRVVASTGFSFGDTPSDFFYSSHSGIIVLYNRVFLVIFGILTVIFPAYLVLKELHNNNWYMYTKMGYTHTQLLFNRYILVYPRVIRTYLIGILLTLIGSVALLGTGELNYGQIALSLALGILVQTVIVGFLFMVSALFKPAYAVSIAAVPVCVAWNAILNSAGLFDASSSDELDGVFEQLFSFGISGVIIIPVLILALSVAITFMLTGKHSSEYNTEELGADDLVDLDVTDDMLVLEKGVNSYKVVISGPIVNGIDDTLEVPKLI